MNESNYNSNYKVKQKYTKNSVFFWVLVLLLAVTAGCAAPGSKSAGQSAAKGVSQVALGQPMEISENVSCGKCGMYPAQYPRWHAQIIFKDGYKVLVNIPIKLIRN